MTQGNLAAVFIFKSQVMKKIFTLLFSIVALSGFAQITNGGFEDTPYDNGWTVLNSATKAAETSALNVHSGNTALKMTAVTTTSLIKMTSFITPSQGNYLASFWVKGSKGNIIKMQNVVKTSTATNYLNYIHTIGSTGTWEKVEAPFAIDASTTSYNIQIQGNTKDAVYYIDDIEITLVNGSEVLNGKMESGVSEHWYGISLSNGAIASISNESVEVHEGSKAMKIVVTTPAATPSIGDVQIKNTAMAIFGGSAKVVSFYAKATPTNQNEIPKLMIAQAYQDEIGKSQSGGAFNGTMQLTSEYRKYKYAVDYQFYDKSTPPVLLTSSYFTNTIRCGEVAGTYYIDAITIEAYPGTPTITSTAITVGEAGKPYSYKATSSNPGLGKWSLSKPEIGAEWLSIDQYTGELTGTPDAGGSYELTVTLADGINTIQQSFTLVISGATSIGQESKSISFKVYPNPASSRLFIHSEGFTEKIEIYSISGQKVLEAIKTTDGIDISQLANGLYIVSTKVHGKVVQQKFSKK